MKNYINEYLAARGVSSEDAELVSYGLYKLVLFFGNVILSLLIGFLFKCPIYMIVFLVTYIPLRIYAGGFHLRKLLHCEIFSVIVVCIVAFIMRYWADSFPKELYLYASGVAVIIHFILAPQDSTNKRLYDFERRRFKSIVCILVVMYFFALVLLLYLENRVFLTPLLLSMVVSAVSLLENSVYEHFSRK